MSLPSGSCLWHGQFLTTGQSIYAENMGYVVVQNDGNLVWYTGSPSNPGSVVWASNSEGSIDDYFLIMQGDGNLCVYRGTGPTANRGLIWHTNTPDTPSGDGNYVFMITLRPIFEIGSFPSIMVFTGHGCNGPSEFDSLTWVHTPGL